MYLNQRMLTNPSDYDRLNNTTLLTIASELYNQFCDNNWWPVQKQFESLETFTDTHHITLKPSGAVIEKLDAEPEYRYTEIAGQTFINSGGWWLPLKLFPGLTDDTGALLGDCRAYTVALSVANVPWIKDCCFKYSNGYLDFWFTEDSFPIKVLSSRSMQEVRLCRYFKDTYGVNVSVNNESTFASTLRCYVA